MVKLLKDFIFASEYTLKEKIMLIPSAFYSLRCLWHDVVTTDLFTKVTSVEVPVYIFQGVYDYQVSYNLAKLYLNNLKAPHKEFISFENSAHSPITEEYKRFNKTVIDIVKGSNVQHPILQNPTPKSPKCHPLRMETVL